MSDDGRRAPVQEDTLWALPYHREPGAPHLPYGTIAWSEHMEVWEAYHRRYPGQSAEKMAERGGFGHCEIRELIGHDARTFVPAKSAVDLMIKHYGAYPMDGRKMKVE